MRLWHIDLLNKLPQKQICGQWRECAALMGNGWGRKHATVDYAFLYPEEYLVAFSMYVYQEMINRGYHPNKEVIFNSLIKRHTKNEVTNIIIKAEQLFNDNNHLYYEHNDKYMQECLDNLKNKGIILI